MSETLIAELSEFVGMLERKERAAVYHVPDEIIKNVKRAKSLEPLLHDVFMQASGTGKIQLAPILRREFGMRAELADHIDQWAPYSKERFEDELHDAINRAEIRAGNQGVFFHGTPSKEESQDALRLLRDIAHSTVQCYFRDSRPESDAYVSALDKLLQFYALPNTYPEGNAANYMHLISGERLSSLSEHESITRDLKDFAKEWYQRSPHTFLESREGYFSFENVRNNLYILSQEQVERLRESYLEHIREEFSLLKKKPDLHRAKKLEAMLEDVVGWAL